MKMKMLYKCCTYYNFIVVVVCVGHAIPFYNFLISLLCTCSDTQLELTRNRNQTQKLNSKIDLEA